MGDIQKYYENTKNAALPHPMVKKFINMKTLVENIAAQYEAFATNAALQVEKNNKAAGTRARKAALELSKLLKEFRAASVAEAKK